MFYTLGHTALEVLTMSVTLESPRTVSAFLESDGSITVILVCPEGGRPLSLTIDPIETTIQAAGSAPRPIDLTYGSEHDRHLRLIVAMHVDALAYERDREQAGPASHDGAEPR